uniref:Uncharacterized protein n=1 Tax=Oryza meridionalis TaxID=40149 RepID=A0A0E0BYH6_9ORYZ
MEEQFHNQEHSCGFVTGRDALLSPSGRPISTSRSACAGAGGGVAPLQPSNHRRAALLAASTTTATPAMGLANGCGRTAGCC